MLANFACPHCQAMLQMDVSHAGGQVRCPACSQAFSLAAPPPAEPEVPVATLVRPHAPAPPAPHAPQTPPRGPVRSGPQPVHSQAHHPHTPAQPQRPTGRPQHPPHPQQRAAAPPLSRDALRAQEAKEEAKAKVILGSIIVVALVGTIFLVRWGLGAMDKAQSDGSVFKELARMDARRNEEAVTAQRESEKREEAAREVERSKMRDFLSLNITGGDDAVAGELLTALEKVQEETTAAFQNGTLPEDVPGFMEGSLLNKMAESAVLRKWFGARSPRSFARALFGSMEQQQREAPAAGQGQVPALFASGKYVGMGTGFFVSADGWLVTNQHVVQNAREVDIRTADGTVRTARVVKTDPQTDVALLKMTLTAPAWLPLTKGEASMGTGVFTVGFPRPTLQGIEPKFTDGTVSSLSGLRDDSHTYQISVPVQPGNSGGPLVHMKSGWAVGVVCAKLNASPGVRDTPQNVNFAVKSGVVRTLLEATPEAKSVLDAPAPANIEDTGAIIEKVKSATVLVLVSGGR